MVRFSGGHQAGHTVIANNIKHIFSHFGSGTLRGIPTYWSKFCTISPVSIINEFNVLKEKGISPVIYIDKNCPITTPYDESYNRLSKENREHGTCGVGFGATIEREENHCKFHFEDIFNKTVFKIKIQMLQEYYKNREHLEYFISCCEYLFYNNTNFIITDKTIFNSYDYLVFEGSQGLLLDKDIGFFPHVTRSNTDLTNIYEMNVFPNQVYLVTRAYQTRHGNGPMTNITFPHKIKKDDNEINVFNKYQGKFRRSLLDVDLLKYAINKLNFSDNKNLVITCLDHIENEHKFFLNEKLVCCDNEFDFVNRISNELKIPKTYVSRSPYSEKIKLKGE